MSYMWLYAYIGTYNILYAGVCIYLTHSKLNVPTESLLAMSTPKWQVEMLGTIISLPNFMVAWCHIWLYPKIIYHHDPPWTKWRSPFWVWVDGSRTMVTIVLRILICLKTLWTIIDSVFTQDKPGSLVVATTRLRVYPIRCLIDGNPSGLVMLTSTHDALHNQG